MNISEDLQEFLTDFNISLEEFKSYIQNSIDSDNGEVDVTLWSNGDIDLTIFIETSEIPPEREIAALFDPDDFEGYLDSKGIPTNMFSDYNENKSTRDKYKDEVKHFIVTNLDKIYISND